MDERLLPCQFGLGVTTSNQHPHFPLIWIRMKSACSCMMPFCRNSPIATTYYHNKQLPTTTWEVVHTMHSSEYSGRVWNCWGVIRYSETKRSTSIGQHGYLQQYFVCQRKQSKIELVGSSGLWDWQVQSRDMLYYRLVPLLKCIHVIRKLLQYQGRSWESYYVF